MSTNDTDICIIVQKDRWENKKNILIRLQAQVRENPEVDFCTHSIMPDRGTLGYVTQTYDPLNPYLKGLHHTIYSWRPYRDYDDRKVAKERLKSEKLTESGLFLKSVAYPETVKPEKRLLSGMKYLVEPTSSETSPILIVESSKLQYLKCVLGDTYGGVFVVTTELESVLDIETGTWNACSKKSYNFIELINFVYKLENDAAEGNLADTETFMFTDNTTTEAD